MGKDKSRAGGVPFFRFRLRSRSAGATNLPPPPQKLLQQRPHTHTHKRTGVSPPVENKYAWQLLRASADPRNYEMILKERREWLRTIDLAEKPPLLAEWLALIVELDTVSREALGVDAKGFVGQSSAQATGRKKRSWSFTKGSVFSAGKSTAYSTASGGSRRGAEGGGEVDAVDNARRRSNSFLSYFGGGNPTGGGGRANATRMAEAEMNAAAEADDRAGREQQVLGEAIRLHKNKMRELAQREARARADSAEASWQLAVAEAEARAAEEELAMAPPLLDAEREGRHNPSSSHQHDQHLLSVECTPAVVLEKLFARQQEVARTDRLDPNVTAKSYV